MLISRKNIVDPSTVGRVDAFLPISASQPEVISSTRRQAKLGHVPYPSHASRDLTLYVLVPWYCSKPGRHPSTI